MVGAQAYILWRPMAHFAPGPFPSRRCDAVSMDFSRQPVSSLKMRQITDRQRLRFGGFRCNLLIFPLRSCSRKLCSCVFPILDLGPSKYRESSGNMFDIALAFLGLPDPRIASHFAGREATGSIASVRAPQGSSTVRSGLVVKFASINH